MRPGDTVAVVAPSGPFDRDCLEAGLAVLNRRYQVRYDPSIFDRFRYLAGDDDSRLVQLTDALARDAVRAVFCARGGYGAMRLLPRLPALRKGPPLVGFSDITALHQWYQCHGLVSIHGPVVTQLGRLAVPAQERLFHLLESTNPAPPLRGAVTLVPGMAEGPLLGGNLSVFTRLLGTPYLPALEGAVLLLEDLAERPYRLDRMWTHMQLAGVFRKVRGIALGTFTNCEERDVSYSSTDVLKDLANATGLPCALGFQIGHGDANEAVPLGTRVRLDADARLLTFLEPAVEHTAH